MRKRIVLSFLALLFAVWVVSVSLIKLCQKTAIGLEEKGEVGKISLIEEKSKESSPSVEKALEEKKEEEKKTVDYYLPYPGILPDHPLYWLKMIRDRILLWLTKEPVQRLERLLLYADKRLGAAKVLIEGGKEELGVTTATKAEKYLEQVVAQLEKTEKEGKADAILREKVAKATLKHQEILEEVLEKVPEETKGVIRNALEKTKIAYEEVTQLMQEKGEKSLLEKEK